MSNWENADGLQVQFGNQDPAVVGTDVAVKHRMAVDFRFDELPAFTADLDNNGTNDGFSGMDAYIPAGSYITSAQIVVTTAFTGGTSYNIGFYEADGSVIDVDGVDAAVAAAALAAGKAVNCNGDLVGGTLTLTENAYLVIADTGGFTTGAGKLYIDYVEVLA